MKRYLSIFLFSCCLPLASLSQHSVMLRSGNVTPSPVAINEASHTPQEIVNGKYYRFIQFKQLPDAQQKEELSKKGIVLYNYVPHNTYMAAIPASLNLSAIQSENIYAIFPIEAIHKLDKFLATKQYPNWATQGKNKIELVVTHHPDINHETVAILLAAEGIQINNSLPDVQAYSIFADTKDIDKIAALPYLYFVEVTDGAPIAENLVGRTNHRANAIATEYAGGLKFDGRGVNVALNDDGTIGAHIDYTGRLTDQYITFNNGDHGDHCAGILFGAGNRNPTTRGMASGANLGVYGVGPFPTSYQAFDSINNHYTSKDIRITSTSYGNGNNAGYTTLARLMDVQVNSMRELTHVFSAGNSGALNYGYGAGPGWGNITGGHKQAKNVIAVANLDYRDVLSSSSSRGPAYDGRIKPDIAAVGSSVYSTVRNNSYANNSGTSMACPAIAGVAAQLYQAYKEMNNGANPQAALIKAVLLNTADDIGNPGPDYKYGWGRVNARRAYNLLAANQYKLDTVANAANKNYTIAVPANVAELRVMVYWQDYEATANASKALVNDLNMSVIDPQTQTLLPWVLNHAPNATTLDQAATRGVDALNNMEQVTITNPAAGNYTVNVAGFQVPQGPQPYYIVYEFVKNDVVVTYPMGGESLVPAQDETIRWDAHGNTGTFTLEYSTNNGTAWTTIATGIAAGQRYYNWTVPAAVTGQALIRVTRGSLSDQSDAPFSIIDVPASLNHDWSCIDSMQVSYSTVSGATGYIVSILGDKYMDSAGFSTTGTCVVRNIDTRKPGWFTVQAVGPNGCIGRKANARDYVAVPYGCAAPEDVALIGFTSPSTASVITCSQIIPNDTVKVVMRNNSFSGIGLVPVKYSINNGAPVTITSGAFVQIAATDTINFAQAAGLTTPGTYTIKAWLDYSSPQNTIAATDTITMQKTINTTTAKTTPFKEDFENFTLCSTSADCGATVCPTANDWLNENNSTDGIDWRVNAGPTPTRTATSLTGPTMDHLPGTATGKYVYLEASQCAGKEAHIITPCLDLNGIPGLPVVNFAYHMFGSDMGELHVDVLANGVWHNDIMPAISGNNSDSWKRTAASLQNFRNQVINIRFRGITGAGENSDMALDNIRVEGVENISGIEENGPEYVVYPNPSSGQFTLTTYGNTLLADINIADISGKFIRYLQVPASENVTNTAIDMSGTAPGIYLMTIKTAYSIKHHKLVIK